MLFELFGTMCRADGGEMAVVGTVVLPRDEAIHPGVDVVCVGFFRGGRGDLRVRQDEEEGEPYIAGSSLKALPADQMMGFSSDTVIFVYIIHTYRKVPSTIPIINHQYPLFLSTTLIIFSPLPLLSRLTSKT